MCMIGALSVSGSNAKKNCDLPYCKFVADMLFMLIFNIKFHP